MPIPSSLALKKNKITQTDEPQPPQDTSYYWSGTWKASTKPSVYTNTSKTPSKID